MQLLAVCGRSSWEAGADLGEKAAKEQEMLMRPRIKLQMRACAEGSVLEGGELEQSLPPLSPPRPH